MEHEREQLEALQDIRRMMQDSSRFLSLSGLSGVFAGIYALIGAYMGQQLIQNFRLHAHDPWFSSPDYPELQLHLFLVAAAVLVGSIATVLVFSIRKAQKNNRKLDHTAKKLLVEMLIPLSAGGLFCFALVLQHSESLLCPVMLLFYGMALVNASKYTLSDVKYLGYMEIALGVTAAFFTGYGLQFWALGFGVLHILYGSLMWYKYDREN